MSTVYVAVTIDHGRVAVQAARTREGALTWLAERIPAWDWEAFYDSLDPAGRGPMTRDRSAMTAEQVLDCYAGPAGSSEPDTWGTDVYQMAIVTQELLGPVPRATTARLAGEPGDLVTCPRCGRSRKRAHLRPSNNGLVCMAAASCKAVRKARLLAERDATT